MSRRPVLPMLACGLVLLALPALAQGGGSSGGSSGGGGAASGGQGAPTGAQSPTSPGRTGAGQRAQTEDRLRQQGAAPSAEENERQLRDLNAISRQLGTGADVPAPEVERPPPR